LKSVILLIRRRAELTLHSSKRTYFNVQALRGVSAIIVLLYHLACREIQDWPDASLRLFQPFYFFGNAGVDLFFVISGFVITSVTIGDFGKPGKIIAFLQKRFYRIYPIYWITCLPVLCWSVIHRGRDWFGSLAALMLVPRYTNEINPVSWSLVHEVLFYALFAVLMLAPARLLPLFICFWAAVSTWRYFDPTLVFPNWIYSPIVFNLVNFGFMFGVAIALLARLNRMLLVRPIMLIGIALLACGAVFSSFGNYALVHGWPNRVVFLELTAACIVYGAIGLELQGKVWSSRWLQTLGDASYSIYLVHYIIILAAKPFYPYIHGTFWRGCWTLSVFAVAVATGLLTYRYLERPLLKLFKEKTSSLRTANLDTKVGDELKTYAGATACSFSHAKRI